MVRISKLPNIDPDVVSRLKDNNVTTVEDLWLKIGPKFKTGIRAVAQTTGVAEEQLYEILKQQPVSGFLSRHWREVLALIIIVVLLTLLVWRAVQRHDTLVVNAPNGLPAFHIIAPGEVRPEKRFGRYDSFTSESEVTGNYLLQPVSDKTVLLKSQLASEQLKNLINGRQILTIPVKSSAISSPIGPASRVRLLFSPRNAADIKTSTTPELSQVTNYIVDDVIVVSIKREGGPSSITLAFKSAEDLTRALALLTTSELIISE